MAMSGVKVQEGCVNVFNKQKMGKVISFVSYKLSDDNASIVVEYAVSKSGDRVSSNYDNIPPPSQNEKTPDELWDLFKSSLPSDECRYYSYDCKYGTKAGTTNEKLCFITWAPETAKIKSKMLIAASKETIKKALVGFGCEFQASDLSDLEDYQTFAGKVAQSK